MVFYSIMVGMMSANFLKLWILKIRDKINLNEAGHIAQVLGKERRGEERKRLNPCVLSLVP
jgi:hypothetical protein